MGALTPFLSPNFHAKNTSKKYSNKVGAKRNLDDGRGANTPYQFTATYSNTTRLGSHHDRCDINHRVYLVGEVREVMGDKCGSELG